MRRLALAALTVLVCLPAASASAADPGRWKLSAEDPVPTEYFQGLTHSSPQSLLFVGVFKGGYLTDLALKEQTRTASLIPAEVESSVGFNHIGDPTSDGAEGGRFLMPLECYNPGQANGGNTCGMGGIGVVDPGTLAWRYWVRLDPADIPKAMWAEVSPDGTLLWTSSGNDLLAYATADISAANAAGTPDAPPIRPVARLAGAVPPSGITGAVFYEGRLFLAGQGGAAMQIWSVDVTGATPARLEIELTGVRAESEGLDVIDARGGTLHWLLSPVAAGGPPTYGSGHSELLSFVPASEAALQVRVVSPAALRAGRRSRVTVRVSHTFAGRAHRVAGARVTLAGRRARTGSSGTARLTVRPRKAGRLTVRASKLRLTAATTTLRVRR